MVRNLATAAWRPLQATLFLGSAVGLLSACVPTLGTSSKPDLVVTIIDITALSSGEFDVAYLIRNKGNARAKSFIVVDFYASPGSKPSVGDAEDDSTTVTDPLGADGSFDEVHPFFSFGAPADGTAYLVVDGYDFVAESNESNNVSAGFDWSGGSSTACADTGFTAVTQGQTLTSQTVLASDSSYYCFDAVAGSSYTVTMTPGWYDDLYVYDYDTGGLDFDQSSTTVTAEESILVSPAPRSGAYVIQVLNIDGNSDTFDLSLD
jgi:hypothetical protein